MSVEICFTCRERLARSKGECATCVQWRYRHGSARPQGVVIAHLRRRAERQHPARPGPKTETGACVASELLSTLRVTGRLVPGGPELCGVCGTVTSWVEGKSIPLCLRHRGVVALVGLLLTMHGEEPIYEQQLRNLLSA